PLAMRIDMQTALNRYARIKHHRPHQLTPQQGRPVVRPWLEPRLVEKAIITSNEGVVHHDLHAGLCQSPELVEISEAVEKSRTPSIPTAGSLRRFGKPDGLARHDAV